MHIQYASLVVDDQYNNSKTSTKSKSNSVISKSDQQISDGKSFRKVISRNRFIGFVSTDYF